MIKAYKFHLNDEHEKVIELVKEAQKLGREAAKAQLAKLEKAGPKWAVQDGFTKKTVGTMLDVCGFASLTVPGNSPIVKAFKKLSGQVDGNGNYTIDDMRIGKAYQRGYNLNLKLGFRQELSVNEEAVRAASEFLNLMGLECSWDSRID